MSPSVAKIWKPPFRHLTFELNKGTVRINRIYCKGSCSNPKETTGTFVESILANKLYRF